MSMLYKLSPSAAHRWIPCPGSAFLAPLQAWSPSVYAAKGTAVQLINELCLNENRDPSEWLGEVMLTDGFKISITQKDVDAARHCIEQIRYSVDVDGCELRVEHSFELPIINSVIRGRADFDLVNDEYLEVVDYKNGTGHYVGAYRNWQLFIYLLALQNDVGEQPQDNRIKRLSIIMPNHRLGDSSWVVDENAYTDMLQDLYTSVETIEGLSKLAPHELVERDVWHCGEHCKWCPGELNCPAKSEALIAAAIRDGAIGDVQAVWVLNNEKHIRDTLSEARKIAQRKLESGDNIEGYKLVQTTGRATGLHDKDNVLLNAGIGAEITTIKYPGVGEARKIAKQKGIDIEPCITYSESSVVVVSADDKRPAYVPAKEMFEDDTEL